MPTIFVFFGYRFLFYSNDHEPVHVHVVIIIERWKNFFNK